KQRWKTQMLPFGATCTRMTSPHFLPFGPFMLAGRVGQSGTRRYGFGSVGLGVGGSPRVCPYAGAKSTATRMPEIANCARTRLEVGTADLLEQGAAYCPIQGSKTWASLLCFARSSKSRTIESRRLNTICRALFSVRKEAVSIVTT